MADRKNQNPWRDVRRIFIALLAVGGISFGVSLFTDVGICLFYIVTGIPFFSCGMGRAVASLPRISQAFFYHPLVFTVPLIPFIPLLPPKKRRWATIGLSVLFVGVWAIRMGLYFPHTAPMDFNHRSLAALLFGRN